MKTRYMLLEPGDAPERVLFSPLWVEGDLDTVGRSIDNGPDAPDLVPTYKSTRLLLRPLFPGRDIEHVSVNGPVGPTDMFVDDMGMADAMPVNDAATVVYWAAGILRMLQQSGGIETEQEYPFRWVEAVRLGMQRLAADRRTPRIHGRAVLFEGRIWF